MGSVEEYDKISKIKEQKLLFSISNRPISYDPPFSNANKAKHCLCGSEENKYLHINVNMLSADMSVMKANGWQFSDLELSSLPKYFMNQMKGQNLIHFKP